MLAAGGTATAGDVQAAMAAARAAAAGWAATPMAERGGYLSRAAAIVTANADAWGTELAREEGKTFAEGRGEVLRAAQILTYYSAESDRMAGEVFSSPRRGEKILVTRKPLGVVGVITPFNFPIAIPAWKIAPALVFGNTVVWKPASTVPLLALRLAQALVEAGLPAGVLNLVIGSGLARQRDRQPPGPGRAHVHRIHRGGPHAGGRGRGRTACRSRRKWAARTPRSCSMTRTWNSPPSRCSSGRSAPPARSARQPRAWCCRIPSPMRSWTAWPSALPNGRPATRPIPRSTWARSSPIRPRRKSVPASQAAVAQGAITRFEGDVSGLGAAFVAPTVLEIPAGEENIAWRDEFFGPVLAVRRAATTAEAFALANDSEYGLSCAVFTQDLTKALDAMETIDVGILHVNSESAGADPHVPFGGAKKSGYGPKEQGGAAQGILHAHHHRVPARRVSKPDRQCPGAPAAILVRGCGRRPRACLG